MINEAPDWRASLAEILKGIEQELAGPNPASTVLEDLKVMLDNTRSVVKAYASTTSVAEYLTEIRSLRISRTIGVCRNVTEDIRAGRIGKETLGLPELVGVLDDVLAQLSG